jgi:hypothetical protein
MIPEREALRWGAPRLFYVHFWATGDPVTLAQGLKAALDATNSAKPARPQ